MWLAIYLPREALKAGPIANAAGLHLDPSTHRWTRDSPDAPLFHTTTHAAMDHISQHGLQPRQGAGVFGHGGYAEHSQGKVFLSAHDDAARHWHEKVAAQIEDSHGDNEGDDPEEGDYVGHRIPVMLRVAHRKTQVDPVGDKDIPGSRMVKKAIPASDVEYWHPGKQRWRPASTWGDDTGTRHATEEDDHGRRVNADAFAAPRSAAYRDDRPAEAREQAEAEAKKKAASEARAREDAERQKKEDAARQTEWMEPHKRRMAWERISREGHQSAIPSPRLNSPPGVFNTYWQNLLNVDAAGKPHPEHPWQGPEPVKAHPDHVDWSPPWRRQAMVDHIRREGVDGHPKGHIPPEWQRRLGVDQTGAVK